MRLRRLRRWWPVIPVVFFLLFVYAAWPGRWTFTVSPETTHVIEPRDAEGYVDFPAALHARLSKGVTPENNANVLIWQALGPHPEGGTMPPAYFQWLGVESPPEEGNYFLSSDKYFDANLKRPPAGRDVDPLEVFELKPDPKKQWDDRLDRARNWPWQALEHPDIAAWLKQNEKPLAVVFEASKRPEYYNPMVSKSADPRSPRLMNSLLPNVQKCRALADALRCRAMSRTADGDFDGAWQDLMACQRLGRHITRGASLIESLVGIAVVTIASNGQVTLLSHGKHSSKQVLAWLSELQKLPPVTPFADKLDLGERFVVLDSLQSIAIAGPDTVNSMTGASAPPPQFTNHMFTWSIDFDPAFRNLNLAFDEYVVVARMTDRAARKREFADINNKVGQVTKASAQRRQLEQIVSSKGERGEQIGNILIGLLLPAMDKIQDSYDRTQQTQVNLHIAFALAAYRADAGRYPARLDDLAPKYLAKVPADVFSGKPLIYRPTENGYLLYSVGVNGVDEDGRWTDDEPKGDDLRVRMPVPEPARKDTIIAP